MDTRLLDQLEIPRPPYRMARPVASLAAAGDATTSLADKLREAGVAEHAVETAPTPQVEKSPGERAIERADSQERLRDRTLEADNPPLREAGEVLSQRASDVRTRASQKPEEQPVVAPSSVASQPRVTIQPTIGLGREARSRLREEANFRIREQKKGVTGEHEMEKPSADELAAAKSEARVIEPRTPVSTPEAKPAAPPPTAVEVPAPTEAPAETAAQQAPEAKEARKEHVWTLAELEAERKRLEEAAIAAQKEGNTQKAGIAMKGAATMGQQVAAQRAREENAAPASPAPQEAPKPETAPAPAPEKWTAEDEQRARQMLADKNEREIGLGHATAYPPGYDPAKFKDGDVEYYRQQIRQQRAAKAGVSSEAKPAEAPATAPASEKWTADDEKQARSMALMKAQWRQALGRPTRFAGEPTEEHLTEEELEDARAFIRSNRGGPSSPAENVPASKTEAAPAAGAVRAEQEKRGAEMAAEAEERAKREGEEKIPAQEHMTVRNYLSEAAQFIFKKSGAPMETLSNRMDARAARWEATFAAFFQDRAGAKLTAAEQKIALYQQKMAKAGILGRAWYSSRIKSWQSRAAGLEAKVEKWNMERERKVEVHNAFKREVVHAYDREMAPFKEIVRDFSVRLETHSKIRDTLARHREDAVRKLTVAEAEGKKGRWFMAPEARAQVNRIKAQIKEMDERIGRADKTITEYGKRLSGANANIRKWELKKDAVAHSMRFPEFDTLRKPKHSAAVEIPAARTPEWAAAQPRQSAPPEAPAPSQAEKDPSAATWDVTKFAESWNGMGLERIVDRKAFSDYITHERTRLRQAGPPTAGQLLDLAEPYLKRASPAGISDKQLKRDRQFFLDNAKPS